MKKILSLLAVFVILLAACSTGSDNVDKLNIALMPAVEGETYDPAVEEEVNAAFKEYLEEQLGVEVELFSSQEYTVGITALGQGELDVLLVSPMSYYQATQQADVEPLVTTTSEPGSPEYKSVFITTADNDNINELADLEGNTFAFVDQASSSGYLYPKYTLVDELGLESDQLENNGYFFESVSFSGGHPNTLISVLNGGVDAGAVAYQMLDYIPSLIDGKTADDVKIIGETPVIPNPLFIMRSELPDDIKTNLKEAYLGYDDSKFFETIYGNSDIRFTETDDSALEDAKNVVETLGVEAE